MRLAIMQPYLFPYLGYFQLMAAVDRFVVYDDVAYIKNGWVNRNRVLLDGEVHWFTVPVRSAPLGTSIRDVQADLGGNVWRKLRSRLEHGYRKAPYRDVALGMVDEVLGSAASATASIGDLARASVLAVATLLDLKTGIVPSSSTYGNNDLKGTQRVIDICHREGANVYCNAPGGRTLYDPVEFSQARLELRFLQTALPPYAQPRPDFVAGLSILDVIMQAGPEAAAKMTRQGTLVP